MNELHRFLVTYVLNSLWQLPMLSLVAFASATLLRRTSLVLEHRAWVATLFLGTLLPLASASGWLQSLSDSARNHSTTHSSVSALAAQFGPNPNMQVRTAANGFLSPSLANAVLIAWIACFLYRALALLWAWRRTSAMVRKAVKVEPAGDHNSCQIAPWNACGTDLKPPVICLLVSDEIAAPATVGVLQPVILVPRKLIAEASKADFAAMLAHESAHIERHDFLLNMLYEVALLPLAYHPVSPFVRARIADSRERICDRMAAAHSASPVAYAGSLVRLAESLLSSPRTPQHAMGMFEGNNLEDRVMNLLNNTPRLGKRASITVVVLFALVFGSCCVAASAFSFQPAAIVADELKPYAGTWHWMFRGKPFTAMILVPSGDHFTGTMTNGDIGADKDGNMIDARSEPGTSAVVRTFFSGKVLHIIVENSRDKKDETEFTMVLTAPGKAEFNAAIPGVVPEGQKAVKPWPAERVAEDTAPPVNKSEPYQVGGDVKAPKLTYSADPKYPPGHDAVKEAVICVLAFTVDEKGIPNGVRIKRSGGTDYDESAIASVKQYKFEPAMFKGKPVPVQMSIEVNFKRY